MPLRPELRFVCGRCGASRARASPFVTAVSVASPLALPASAGELGDLRKENAQRRRELDAAQGARSASSARGSAARRPTASTRGAAAAEDAAEKGAAEEKAARTEAELVPMQRDPAAGRGIGSET